MNCLPLTATTLLWQEVKNDGYNHIYAGSKGLP